MGEIMTREEQLGTERLSKLMMQMAIPSIVAQVINILYNIVDRIYIGHIPGVGSSALTGVGLVLPIITLIAAFSAFASAAGAPLASIQLGLGNKKEAEKILGNSVALLVIFTVGMMILFYAFYRPFLFMFGASEATIPFAAAYLNIYLAGTIFVELALGLNTFIIIQGQAKIAMYSILIGAILNLILDPIFIFVLGMGVKGAAIATVISQFFSALWNVGFLVSKTATLTIRKECIRLERKVLAPMFALGISPFVMRSTESLISIVMNRQLQIFGGDLYVGSLTIMQSILQFINAPLNGFTQGVQPIIGYNYGAGKFDRVRKSYRIMIAVSFGVNLAATLFVVLFPRVCGGFFSNDPEMIQLVGKTLPIFMAGMLIFGVQIGIQPTFIALGQAKISLFIAMLRKVILLVPLALILPNFFGVMGVYFAEPISDAISAITASTLFYLNINKILTEQSLNKMRR